MTHWKKGSHNTGHSSVIPNSFDTDTTSSAVVPGVIRSTIELGNATSLRIHRPSSASRAAAKDENA